MPLTRLETLKRKLIELEAAIAETEKRLPAHSTKPPVMQDLLELEDERDQLLREISELAPDGNVAG
jgi:flagellar hook-associated protein FlgK